MASRCAIWARVSTDEQESGNQLAELRQWAARRGLEVAAEYVLDGASTGTAATVRIGPQAAGFDLAPALPRSADHGLPVAPARHAPRDTEPAL